MRPYLYILVMGLLSLPLSAEVYKYKDAQGRTVYSDSPPPKDRQYEKVEFKPINTQPATEPQPPELQSIELEDNLGYDIAITTPADGSQVPPGQRDLQLAVQVEPALKPGHAVQFVMDGENQGEPTRSNSLIIEEIYRGTHTLDARVVDSQGTVLATADTVTVHVLRPSVNSPAR